jgi:DNA polymerase-4
VAADQAKYIWTSEQIFELLQAYGFEVVYASIDEFQMDIAEAQNPKGLALTIQKQIEETFRITASIGIAKNSILAKLASKLNKPNGIAILTPDNLQEILAVVPVKKLCGVGEKTAACFEILGIKTCLDLYQKSPQFLEQNLGQNGLNLYISLHSHDCFDPCQKEQKIKSIGHSYTFSWASENAGFIKGWLRLLSEMIARRLRQKNLAAKTVQLWLDGPEMAHFETQKTYKEPTNDGYEVYLRSLKVMAKIGPKLPKIRALGIISSNLFSVNYPPLFNEEKRREALVKAVDSINTKQGDWTIYPAVITLTRNHS